MAVSAEYLAKLQRAVRVKTATATVTEELTDLAEAYRADLIALGVHKDVANDESNPEILGAAKLYLRWQLAPTPEEAAGNRGDYMLMRDEFRRRKSMTEVASGAND